MKIIILAGGNGTRLFPLSRECYPKQFLKIAGQESLLQQTIKRFLGLVKPEDILLIINQDHIFHAKADLAEIGASQVNIITEPASRNTAPAIALGLAYIRQNLKAKDNECIFVSPLDQLITPEDKFLELVKDAESIALMNSDNIVTIGVVPEHPETGYGYIQASSEPVGKGFKVQAFKEKPDLETAKAYVASGQYYWNAGMFIFSLKAMENAIRKFVPEIAMAYIGYDQFLQEFTSLPKISIDYAVAEKSQHMVVLPMGDISWIDIGSFDSISEVLADKNGNALVGDVVAENIHNTMVLGSNRLIATIGVEDMLVVDTPDVLLVAKKGEGQAVKQVVEKLKADNRKEVSENVTMYRPWGEYTILAEGDGFKVKKITVNPGCKLSLQMHYHRSEHWTVISGTGKLTLDDKVVIFKENESTYIPIAVKHRLENPGQMPLSIIEVQNGKYLGEDDIVRFDDVYGRADK